jgi:hypothetical protein
MGTDGPDLKGGRTPWIGPRWTGGPSPQATVHGPRQHGVSIASSRPLTVRHVALLKDRNGEPERGKWMGADINSFSEEIRLYPNRNSESHTNLP